MVNLPHVNVQVVDISEIQDQVPDMMSNGDNGDSSASPVEYIGAERLVESIQDTKNGVESGCDDGLGSYVQ